MCDNVNSNPFAGLFSTINDAASFSSQDHTLVTDNKGGNYVEQPADKSNNDESYSSQMVKDSRVDDEVERLIANVFGITMRLDDGKELDRQLVFIEADEIEHAVFDRLMLPDPESMLEASNNAKKDSVDSHTVQTLTIAYLYESYCRLQQYRANKKLADTIDRIHKIIMRNVSTALQEPDLFQGQQMHSQFILLFMDGTMISPELSSFVHGIVAELCSGDADSSEDVISVAFNPILDIIYKEATQSSLLIFRQYWFSLLQLFASIEPLAKLIIRHGKPQESNGQTYANTLLGAILSLSCLPKTGINGPYDFYDKPLKEPSTAVDNNIWSTLDALSESLHRIFHSLLKCSSEVRHLTLQWIGDCLHANASRGKLWNSHNDLDLGMVYHVSDGFMLNLGNVLLRLCQPFCIKPNDTKVPKIDPTYCAAEVNSENDSHSCYHHMKGVASETCLIPKPEGRTKPVAKSFGFVTECFFLTHRALDLGFRVVLDRLLRTNQELAQIQRQYNDAQTGESNETIEAIARYMEIMMTKYLSLRASLLSPEMLNHLAKFHATTAFWLIQVSLHEVQDGASDYTPKQYIPVSFPLPEKVPDTLMCIPEFVVENTVGFLCFLRRLNPNIFEEQGPSFLNPILTEIIALMESQHHLYNPHLRARLAEGLEALLPTIDENVHPRTPNLGTLHRQQLFTTHPDRHQIVVNLLHVFVSIEMTGQSVQFEQKFNYRRPMYIVMEYLWTVPEHRENFVTLAHEAEENMEAIQPPLFLRFINLLMNDAVFLLDEALSNMAQLRQMLQARENGDLPPNEQQQQAQYLQHIGMIARFDNILGRKTIETLKMLTSAIKSIFCHPTMVDRIASMLNYLLLQLVGPNKKNLKVNDQKEYAFDPANLVLNICEIYINLSKSESFTLAVSQDGRSYSPELFKLADNVLVRIGGVGILGDLDLFAKKVEKVAHQKREEDEILVGAPDEFLDPIMSTLMTDPVILPSSKITIDRQTIARHLLSDQTDPFNRSPLTMDMIKPDTELRKRMEEWIAQRKQERESANNNQSECV